jgi:tRNA G18 (ribose-2'-O)-methylase SpoU
MIVILDNIRSAYNVGSIFRTADGVGAQKLFLCGITAPAYHPKVQKTALGSTEFITSKYFKNTADAIEEAKEEGYKIYGVELTLRARDYRQVRFASKTALVLGNEVDGISEEILKLCDNEVMIPMRGKKQSLNVASSAAVIMYEVTRDLK